MNASPRMKFRTLFSAIAALTATVHAQPEATGRATALEEIIVSAQKQDESIQSTPISLAAFNSADLEKLGLTNIGDLATAVPNLSMRQMPNSKSAMRIYIRGVGSNDVQVTQDPAIAVYADGIYIARSTGLTTELADVERIEVLRGPQGTLYGRNATGGAINVISRQPKGEFGFKQEVTLGNRGLWRSLTTVDLPEYAHVSSKISFLKGSIDGLVDNKGLGPDFGEEDKDALRLALRWAATNDLTIFYTYDRATIDSALDYNQTLNPPRPGYEAVPFNRERVGSATPSVPFQGSNLRISGHSLIAEWELSPSLSLKSLTGYRELEEDLYQDYGANPFTPRLFANDPFATDQHQFSQELQLVGSFNEPAIDYIVGLFYFEEKARQNSTDYIGLNLGAGITAFRLQSTDARAENSAHALYGQSTWTPAILDDRLHLTLGLRYSRDEREIDSSRTNAFDTVSFSHVKGNKTFNKTSVAATAAYDLADDTSIYIKYVEGYRTGGFNARATRPSAVQSPVDAETVNAYEIGFKSQWLDSRLRVNLAAFAMSYDDMQLSFQQAAGDTRLFNAGKAEITGFELDISAVPVEGLVATLNYANLNYKVKDVVNPVTGLPPIGNYVLTGAPENTVNADLEYTFPRLPIGELMANLNYTWRDVVWAATDSYGSPYACLPSYGLFNARLSLADIPLVNTGSLKVALWGKNLLDKEYLKDVVGTYSWSNRVGIFGEPRSYGMDITYEY